MSTQVVTCTTRNYYIPEQKQTKTTKTTMTTKSSYKELDSPASTSPRHAGITSQSRSNGVKTQNSVGRNSPGAGPSSVAPTPNTTTRNGFASTERNMGILPGPSGTPTNSSANADGFSLSNYMNAMHDPWGVNTATVSATSNRSPVNNARLEQAITGGGASGFANRNTNTYNRPMSSSFTANAFENNATRTVDENLNTASLNSLRLGNPRPAQGQQPVRDRNSSVSPPTLNAKSRPASSQHDQSNHGIRGVSTTSHASTAWSSQHPFPARINRQDSEPAWRIVLTPNNDPNAQPENPLFVEALNQLINKYKPPPQAQTVNSPTERMNASATVSSASQDQFVSRAVQNGSFQHFEYLQAHAGRDVCHDEPGRAPFLTSRQLSNESMLNPHSLAGNAQNRSVGDSVRPYHAPGESRVPPGFDAADYGWNRPFADPSQLVNPLASQLANSFDQIQQQRRFEYSQQAPLQGALPYGRILQDETPRRSRQARPQGPPLATGNLSPQVPPMINYRHATLNSTRSTALNIGQQGPLVSAATSGSSPPVSRANAVADMRNDSLAMIEDRLLVEFKATPQLKKRLELKDLEGHIANFSGDQEAARFVQYKFETASNDDKQRIFPELEVEAPKLSMDQFGNYVIQKFFEVGNQMQKRRLADTMRGQVLKLSCQPFACRVVQKALEHVLLPQQLELIQELNGHVLDVASDQSGNHVIQKILETVPINHLGFIFSALRGQIYQLSRNQFGCRVVQRVLDRCAFDFKNDAMREITVNAESLISDSFGNYVIQHVIEKGSWLEGQKMIDRVLEQMVLYSKSKFASNVVEKCIARGNARHISQILSILDQCDQETNESVLASLIKDLYGNYVIQKLIDLLDDEARTYLIDCAKIEIREIERDGCSNKAVENVASKIKSYLEPAKSFVPTGEESHPERSNRSFASAANQSSASQLPRIDTTGNLQYQHLSNTRSTVGSSSNWRSNNGSNVASSSNWRSNNGRTAASSSNWVSNNVGAEASSSNCTSTQRNSNDNGDGRARHSAQSPSPSSTPSLTQDGNSPTSYISSNNVSPQQREPIARALYNGLQPNFAIDAAREASTASSSATRLVTEASPTPSNMTGATVKSPSSSSTVTEVPADR